MTEFKKKLLERSDRFVHCLTEKLLTYALGRQLRFSDRTTIEQIVEELDNRGRGMKDLVELVVLSEAFREL